MRASLLVVATVFLAACGSAPKPVEPPLRKSALEAETDGAKRYGRGEYAVAARRFEEAARLHASIDDDAGLARNRLQLARARLALGQPEAALALARQARVAEATETVDAALIVTQAELALGRHEAARAALSALACDKACPQAASLRLLHARIDLDAGRAAPALVHAEAALALLRDTDEAAEQANAWRAIAAARLALGETAPARAAATTALDIDRRLGLPEKIARDWLLLGDIARKVGVGETAKREAETAYRRALAVAEAANLKEAAEQARRALGPVETQTPK